MNYERKLKIIQQSKHKWRIEGPQGNVLAEDLVLNTAYHATEYIRNYCTSFNCYSYEVIPIKEKK